MPKTIPVTDSQHDWFAARARKGQTITAVVHQVIALVDRYERDLEKYRKWADASKPGKETKHETLPLE